MIKKCKISLCIVTYNNAKIIEETVRSIVENIPDDLEYILYIVDNNSTDNTLEVVRTIPGNIEILALTVNNGFGYSHNQVIPLLDSQLHFVVNPDIVLESSMELSKMVDRMLNDESVGLLCPLIINPDETIQYLCKKNPTVFDMLIRRISPNIFKKRQDKYTLMETGYNKEFKFDYASGCFMVFKSQVFKNIDGFDDDFFMYLEDADISRRVNEVSKTIFYPNARIVHKWARGGHKSLKLAIITARSMRTYFKKWGWKWL